MSIWQDHRYLHYHDWMRRFNDLLCKYVEKEVAITGLPLLITLLSNIINSPNEYKYRFIRRIKDLKNTLEGDNETILIHLGFRLVVVEMEQKWSWMPEYGVSLDALTVGLQLIQENQASWQAKQTKQRVQRTAVKAEKTEELRKLRIIIEEDRQHRREKFASIPHNTSTTSAAKGSPAGYRLGNH